MGTIGNTKCTTGRDQKSGGSSPVRCFQFGHIVAIIACITAPWMVSSGSLAFCRTVRRSFMTGWNSISILDLLLLRSWTKSTC